MMEDVRMLVQEEGRAARNVVAFHVDVAAPSSGKIGNRKPPASSRLIHDPRMTKRSSIVAKTGPRVRSASTGRDKKSELQARYWAFLFGNLQRAVDEIYQTCESDESVSECKEVILVLENYTKDFHNLIEWFKLKWEYENTPPPQRPTSLAWEVRKSSPGKVLMSSKLDKLSKNDKPSPVRKQLNFSVDAKLAPTKELPYRPSENEKILCNQYGLSFGDLSFKDDLNLVNDSVESSPSSISLKFSNSNSVEMDENNKENCPTIAIGNNCDNNDKLEIELTSSDQSSQTESVPLQSAKVSQKSVPPLSVVKKPLPSVKPTGSTKISIPPPLAVSKTVPGVSARKTVPLSPTSTVSPRTIVPGRNVAAATFVPRKPAAACQNKSNLTSNKASTVKPQNIPNLPVDKTANDLNEHDCVDTNKNSEINCQEMVESTNTTITQRNDLLNLDKLENIQVINGNCEKLKDNKTDREKPLANNGLNKEEKKITKTDLADVKNLNDDTCNKCNGERVENKPQEQQKHKEKNVKIEKCDKNIMTDLPFDTGSQTTVKQPVAKVSLVRNKTVPSLTRKSCEALSTIDNVPEPVKITRNSAINITKPVSTVRKQTSINETDKPAYSMVSKVFRSHTSIELRPSKTTFNRQYTTPKFVSQDKQGGSVPKSKTNNIKNQTLNSSSVFKSEQSLRKRNSVDEDGWETVKGRSRWRLSQSSGNIKARTMTASCRYHLPSPATSLPALALAAEEPEPQPKPAKLHKDKQNLEIAKANKSALKRPPIMPKTSMKSESDKIVSSLKKNRSKEEVFVRKLNFSINERKRVSNIKTKNADFKKLCSEETNDFSEHKLDDKFLDILSSEDERINEEEIRKSMELYEEEQMLTKKIQDLEKAEIEVDTETDDAEETDAGSEEEEDTNCRITALKASYEDVCNQLSWADQMDTLEKLEQLMAMDTSTKGIPFSERLATLEQLEELVARHPGRALELHQKLSSPSRRRPLPDTLQRHHARQAHAHQKREQLLQDKSAKMRELLNKVEEVKMAQSQLVEERKKRLEDKLRRAEENRASHLRSIQRKAHDEEEKLREIAFINELEAQNKRHDFMALCQEQQERLQGILDERQRRQEEKAAKEAAVEERRRILEAERQEKIEKMQERRRKREERIGREQQEKEKERLELAREKARDREERLQALQAAQLANVEELQKKILQKQSDSARRHEENIEHIRQRALESGVLRGGGDDEAPRLTPYETNKMCRVCNVLIDSEVYLLSHLRGKAHQKAVKDNEETDDVIIDAPPDKTNAKLAQDQERQRALRKRCKKIRSRMAQRGEEYLAKLGTVATKKLESPNKGRLYKCLRDVDKLHVSQGVGQWPNNAITLLERNLGEINRILEKQNALDQRVFRDLNGFTTVSNILNLALDIPKNMSPYLPPKCFLTTCTVYSLACTNNPDNSRYVFFSNKIALILDLLLNRLNALITDDYKTSNKSSTNLPVDAVAGALMKLFALILSHSQENVTSDLPDMAPRLQDIISYTVSVGVVDKLAVYCSSVRDPIDNNPQAAHFLLCAIQLLTTLSHTKCGLAKGDPTQLVSTLRVTELVGAVSMLYGMLLHQGTPPPTPPPTLPPHTISVTMATLQLLRATAQLDLNMFQSVLGAEGLSLQLRHIASYLLWYCSQVDERPLLHQVIEVVGFFAVMHYDNQMMLQSGHMPTVLQQLCGLPFEYFSDPALSCHLLPSLLACCHANPDNRTILEQELSYQLLEDFMKSDAARDNSLLKLLK